MNKKFYVTTPIYYVNDVPHIGHAYTTIAADVLARYHRLLDEDVFFLTGTDEHGAKVAEAAKEAGKKPKEFCDQVVSRFVEAWKSLNISNDYFIRTTDPRHEKIVQELLQKVYDNGYIYPDTYEGLYCVGCEKFLTETDLVDGKCPLHPNRKPVKQKEENYFFRLKSFQEKLIKAIEDKNDPNYYEILPSTREHEIISKLNLGVEDISISRAGVSWGIPVPWDHSQTVYVWVDALINYYSATQFLEKGSKFWPADLHLIGKDILWFHAVIWQALLLAASLPLPKRIFAHGFFTVNGQKMSKSLGNIISPKELIDRYGIDGTRYLLISAYPFGSDGDISLKAFNEKYNADLANGLGNLVSRVTAMAQEVRLEVKKTSKETDLGVGVAIGLYDFDRALGLIWEKIKKADFLINEKAVWKLKGIEKEEILKDLIDQIRQIAADLSPFLPETAEKIKKQFSGKIKSGSPLFPRLR